MILLQTGPDQFFIGGTALSVTISVDVETREGIAGIASVEEGSRAQGEWITARRLNGDQDNQGRSVFLPDHQLKLLRVKLYTTRPAEIWPQTPPPPSSFYPAGFR